MYALLAEQGPGTEFGLAVRRLVEDERQHADQLAQLLPDGEIPAPMRAAIAPGCGLHDEGWPSALMAAFALDQAATAALIGVARVGDGPIAETASGIIQDELVHQSFAVAAFKSVADHDLAAGRRLAAEMLVVRDWVKQVFPRHATLADLAAAGLLAPDAPSLHDSFLASLGDRVQEALGVLGD
jgi:hypothetical protein